MGPAHSNESLEERVHIPGGDEKGRKFLIGCVGYDQFMIWERGRGVKLLDGVGKSLERNILVPARLRALIFLRKETSECTARNMLLAWYAMPSCG